MTVQAMPWAVQGQSHPAVNANNVTAATFGAPVAAVTAAVGLVTAGGGHGVVDAVDLAVTQNATPNMSVNVAAGRAIIRSGGSSSLLQGCYAFLNDATVNVAISASDLTNARIDLVVAQVRDSNYGEAAADARLTVVAGTPAASPAVPSLSSYPNCVVLAQIEVAAAVTTIVTANITDKRTRASALNAPILCTLATRPTGASLHEGLQIIELDTDRMFIYSGSAWVFLGCYSSTGRAGVVLTDAAQSIATASVTDVTWGTEVSDVDGWTSGASATLTVPTGWGGRYAISYTGTWASNPTTSGCALLINGTVVAFDYEAVGAFVIYGAKVGLACYTLAAGDTIKLQVFQSSGGSVNIVSRLEIAWLGP